MDYSWAVEGHDAGPLCGSYPCRRDRAERVRITVKCFMIVDDHRWRTLADNTEPSLLFAHAFTVWIASVLCSFTSPARKIINVHTPLRRKVAKIVDACYIFLSVCSRLSKPLCLGRDSLPAFIFPIISRSVTANALDCCGFLSNWTDEIIS